MTQQQQGAGPLPPYPQPKKSHGCLYAILGAVGLVVVVIIIVVVVVANSGPKVTKTSGAPAGKASGSASPAASGPMKLAAGQSARVKGGVTNGNATVAITSDSTATQPQSSYGQAPQNGQFVFANVSVSNVTGSSFDINPLDFYAVSSAGGHYDTTSGNAGEAVNNVPTASTLNPGENWSGEVAFDVPAGHGEIVYAPYMNSVPLAEWSY